MSTKQRKILLILGHPDNQSLCANIFHKYYEHLLSHKFDTRALDLGMLSFDPILRKGYREIQELEPDLVKARNDITWADHIILIFPYWWGTMPALLKGFIDRIFLPGFGFKFRANSNLWDKLLTGKTAHLVVTSGSPKIWIRLFNYYGIQTITKGILGFCGINTVKVDIVPSISLHKPVDFKTIVAQIEKDSAKGI